MATEKRLYSSAFNPLLIRPDRPLPDEVAVIGAGTIGPDIGYYLKSAMPDCKLFLLDVVEEPLKHAEQRIVGYTQKAVDKKKMKPEKAAAVSQNIVYTTDYEQIKNCKLVIEAATEDIPLKQKIFAMVEKIVSPRHDHHFQYQLDSGGSIIFKNGKPPTHHRDTLFCPGLAQPAGGSDFLGRRQPTGAGLSVLVFCQYRQSPDHHRQCHLLYPGSHIRQLVQ